MRIFSPGLLGIEPFTIEIEAAFSRGLPGLTIIGLPQETARDIKERVMAALHAIGDRAAGSRCTLSFSSPCDLRLSRLAPSWLELPVAVLLMASHNKTLAALLAKPDHTLLAAGELCLSGALRPLRSRAPLSQWIIARGARPGGCGAVTLLTPPNLSPLGRTGVGPTEAPLVEYTLTHLSDVANLASHRTCGAVRAPVQSGLSHNNSTDSAHSAESAEQRINANDPTDAAAKTSILSATRDALTATLALCARRGRLHVLLAGPPGVGKTYLAELIARHQRPPAPHEETTLALIHGESKPLARPTRRPHHSATLASLTGGARLNIGELGLAHAGVLLLDELAEFPSPTLDALREPLDEGLVRLSRAGGRVDYPADFQLLATMNPCPCGYFLSAKRRCRCQPSRVRSYLGKASGPLLDRFHILAWLDPDDPVYASAHALCEHLLGRISVPQAPVPPDILSNSAAGAVTDSARSAARRNKLVECLREMFPEAAQDHLAALASCLRRFAVLIKESEDLL